MSPIYVQLEDRYQKFLTKRPEVRVFMRLRPPFRPSTDLLLQYLHACHIIFSEGQRRGSGHGAKWLVGSCKEKLRPVHFFHLTRPGFSFRLIAVPYCLAVSHPQMRHKNVGLPPNTLFSKEADLDEYLPYPPLQPLGKLLKEWPPDEVRGVAPSK